MAHITVRCDDLIIKFKQGSFEKLVEKHLRVSVIGYKEAFKTSVPYQTKRGRDGSVIIRPQNADIFDLTPADLKRLIQGIIWRDEHFSGMHMRDIAEREGRSDRYIRNVIMSSFDMLMSA